ncbi:unnamed protein product [Urochloa humidicola]
MAAADEETRHLVQDDDDDDDDAPGLLALGPVPWLLPPPAHKEEKTEARTSTRRTSAWPPRRPWLPLPSFPRPDGIHKVKHDPFRSALPGRLQQLALDRKIVMDCLNLYNSKHPDDEYEPAPGLVTQHGKFDLNGFCWTHGNFVARRKRSGCFSFLPAPRTIFFFELVAREDFDGAVSCIPLDEPVTEAYNFLGFSLGWRSRRDGRADKICKTCYRCCEVHPGPRKPFPCGHDRAEIVCHLCYLVSCVLHPYPGEFAFGCRSS